MLTTGARFCLGQYILVFIAFLAVLEPGNNLSKNHCRPPHWRRFNRRGQIRPALQSIHTFLSILDLSCRSISRCSKWSSNTTFWLVVSRTPLRTTPSRHQPWTQPDQKLSANLRGGQKILINIAKWGFFRQTPQSWVISAIDRATKNPYYFWKMNFSQTNAESRAISAIYPGQSCFVLAAKQDGPGYTTTRRAQEVAK